MNYLLLQRFVQYAPFVVAATASLVLLAHGLHFGPLRRHRPRWTKLELHPGPERGLFETALALLYFYLLRDHGFERVFFVE